MPVPRFITTLLTSVFTVACLSFPFAVKADISTRYGHLDDSKYSMNVERCLPSGSPCFDVAMAEGFRSLGYQYTLQECQQLARTAAGYDQLDGYTDFDYKVSCTREASGETYTDEFRI